MHALQFMLPPMSYVALLTRSLTDGVRAIEPGATDRSYVLWLHTYCKVEPGSVVTDQTRKAIRCNTRATVVQHCPLCHTCTEHH